MNKSGTVRVSSGADYPVPYGLMIDGVIYPLEGQPPLATSGGWFKPSGGS